MASIQMTGMASGLDTKSIVESMLKTEKLKVEKLNKEKQKLEWKQESYREVITSIRDFHKKYFDPLNKETYLMSSNALSGIKATSSVDSTVADISAINSTVKGNYELKVNQLAKPAKVTSKNTINRATVRGELNIPTVVDPKNSEITIDGKKIQIDSKTYESTEELVSNINSKIQENDELKDKYYVSNNDGEIEVLKKVSVTESNYKLNIKDIGGKAYDIDIDKQSYTPDELAGEIESKLKEAMGDESTSDLKVEVKDGQVEVNGKKIADSKNDLEFDEAEVSMLNQKAKSATNKINFSKGFVKDVNSQLVISVRDSNSIIIDLSDVDTSKSKDDILDQISKKINEKSDKVKSEVVDGKLSFSTNSKEQVVISGSAAKSIGINNSLDLNLDITKEKMGNLIKDKKVEFTINGQTFKYDFEATESKEGYKPGKDLTIKQVFSDISSKAGVNISYNTISRKFSIETKETGKEAKLDASDNTGEFLNTLFGDKTLSDKGKDASVDFSDDQGNKNTFEFPSNNFTLADINFNLKSSPTEPIKISVSADTEDTVKHVKQFVEDFNKIMDDLNTKSKEKTDRNYQPLTEDERKEMSEKEIELWEKKAKRGLLGNETQIENFMYQLRNAVFTPVDGVPITFKEVGFDTSNDYTQGGKIQFDEDKFKKALMNDPDAVSDLFTKTSNSGHEVYDPDLSHEEREKKNKDQGILKRINDVINDYTRTNRNSGGKKGIFIEMAGITGDTTLKENTISRSIIEYEKRISTVNDLIGTREKRYYAQFTNMERALTELQSQMSIFGGQ